MDFGTCGDQSGSEAMSQWAQLDESLGPKSFFGHQACGGGYSMGGRAKSGGGTHHGQVQEWLQSHPIRY